MPQPGAAGGVNISARHGQYGAMPVSSSGNGSGGVESVLASAHKLSSRLDEMLGSVAQPIKPFLPGIGRFLIVATFIEDALRIITQWSEQVYYMWNVQHLPYFVAVIFLVLNVLCMFAGSVLVVSKRRLEWGVGALMFVVVSQAVVYGLIFDVSFIFRNVSLVGGLLLAVADAFVRDKRALSLPGLPVIEDKDRSKYIQLAGRVLVVFLFVSYLVTKKWTLFTILSNLLAIAACALVVVGYKARLSASVLAILLTVQNLISNPYWRYSSQNPARDFLRYEHFQTLSIIGGLILLVSAGAGRLSIDEKKKIY
jgi:uncharacterized membrane protein YphA (DoxX/SURF4 family)